MTINISIKARRSDDIGSNRLTAIDEKTSRLFLSRLIINKKSNNVLRITKGVNNRFKFFIKIFVLMLKWFFKIFCK